LFFCYLKHIHSIYYPYRIGGNPVIESYGELLPLPSDGHLANHSSGKKLNRSAGMLRADVLCVLRKWIFFAINTPFIVSGFEQVLK
jgi:hypothetical protein